MAGAKSGRRVSYDKVWGGLLFATCFMPQAFDDRSYPWQLYARFDEPVLKAWLILGSAAGAVALGLGLSRWRSRARHLINFVLGTATLAAPLVLPSIWQEFPYANPGRLPLGDATTVGWVIVISLVGIYVGSGIRIVRPRLVAGRALGALAGLTMAVFAFLPEPGHDAFAVARFKLFADFGANWRTLVPFSLFVGGTLSAVLNLLEWPLEVAVAMLTRALLVAALLFWIAIPFLVEDRTLDEHLPQAWGGLRLLGPLFLALDGCVAFLAISATRGEDE